MKRMQAKAVLGNATYEARWIGRSSLVRLTASGVLPCSNDIAALEKRPERQVPPNWDFVFFKQARCQEAYRLFHVEAVMNNPTNTSIIAVFDACGEHEIEIKSAFEALEEEPERMLDEVPLYCVFADFWSGPKAHTGCLLALEGSPVIGIKSKAFGPNTLDACVRFMAKQCVATDMSLKGGEIPWPKPK